MLKKLVLATAAVATFGLMSASQAAVVSYYNFNNIPAITTAGTPAATGTTTLSPTSGTGSISLAGFGGNVDDFAGSTTNALNSDVAGASLSLLAGGSAAPFPGNDTYVDISFSMTDLSDPILTFATQKTNTGFNSDTLSYSVNGGAFTSTGIAAFNPATSFALVTFDLSSIDALDGATSVVLRYTLSGATSASGNNRIDNLQVNATPEPATLALLGLGGLAALRRRRA